jgi:pimeloyl-ACP methyl ester carboxylesterase
MKAIILAFATLVWLLASSPAHAQAAAQRCPEAPVYGNDPVAGRFAQVNGVSLYYETHGSGAPLLLIHGNGGSVNSVRCQIAYFSRSRRVVVADSRSHGRSGAGPGRLTYEQMADDLSALLDVLKIDTLDVWGHSDGGIIGLLLASRHPQKVLKLISSSPNLRPDESALFPWFINRVRGVSQNAAEMIRAGDRSRDWVRIKRLQDLMLEEPHITGQELQKITAPTLLMFADADIMPLDHAVEIFDGIPQAQLFIMPGATHGMPGVESDVYNAVVARFLDRPFLRPTTQPTPPR